MVHLNLSYFNTIQGPQIFQTVPEDVDEGIVQSVSNLLNISELIKQKFFLYEGGEFKTISLYFEIPSDFARGRKEMLLLNVILSPDFTIENKDLVRSLLEKIEADINQIEKGFMAFYEYDYSKMDDFEDDIEEIALEVRNIVESYANEVELTVKEAKKISMEQIKEIFQQKALGFYVIDEEVLNYLYEIEQGKTPFVQFGNFIESGISVFTSQACIDELQIEDSIIKIINNFIGNREIAQEEIDPLKEQVDPRRLPSDAKISLIVLGKYLKEINPEYDLTVVSPDQKYLRFIQDYYPNLRILPPSSFFLEIINNLENKEGRDYFENLRKRLMNYELQKAMKEQDMGASGEHLTWLIEKAIGVASQPIIPISPVEEKQEVGLQREELSLISKFIAGETILDSEFVKIQDYEEFLNGIKEAQVALKEIQEEIANDELISAQTKIFSTIKQLSDSFLLASATIPEKEKRNQILGLIANFIANFEFLAALSHLNLRQLEQSIERFGLAATFSAIAEQKKKVLISNYLKSITCLYNDSYQDAIHNFAITSELGAKYSLVGYQITCLGGKAISQLLTGTLNYAMITMEEAASLIPNNENDALIMFNEFGDNFYMMGKPEIAIHLFNEALEIAIFLDNEAITEVYNKIERSFYAVGAYNTPLSAELHRLITKAHTLKDADTIEKYNIQIAKLGDINQLLFFEPFPFLTEEWIDGEHLEKGLLNEFDLLHVVVETRYRKRGDKRRKVVYTDLYCYNKELGGVIVRVPDVLELKIKQIPVMYKIALKPQNAKFKIVDSSKEDKQNYYARAIIQTKSKKHLVIKRVFPEIFGKFFEN
ncbi:MAG: hypothetical protein HWN66_08435 [Candidatus Helarchaeota archaeon]|nr:hypothetical protein [Candidatus Helarchaeota archaeon]